MATTYSWDCKTVDVYPTQGANTNVVYNVHWKVNGTSNQLDSNGMPITASARGSQILTTDNITNFVSFENLTNEIAVGWTKGAIGAEEVTSIEARIEAEIASKTTPTSVTLTIGGEPEPVEVIEPNIPPEADIDMPPPVETEPDPPVGGIV